ncbi:hypothetical protein [Ponticoccus alexandrii]|uniref:Secreted protein n=1 Tax=Ponticoccus alexandrii TaxID=1943633 RepID=A0ABX7F6J2_9RHOB|nr:hypothetical protein [Ponticoccus alexandrii]QRF65407.1 hypothetical protein GQA70_03195 [Ponticoccus alexandrii]
MIIRFSALAVALSTGAAFAACSTAEATFLSCPVEGSGKWLEVCAEDQAAVYRYGPSGHPELELVEQYGPLDYAPWPGVGRSVWETVTFYNGSYSYTVYISMDRMDESAWPEGGVTVRNGGTDVAHLDCRPQEAQVGWTEGLTMGKERAGLRWDPGSGWIR